MPVIHEWECKEHGTFEGSHPICPNWGCKSDKVTKVFLTPRGIMSGTTKATDASVRRTAEQYGQSDFKSAKREGDSSKAGNQGDQVLWGNAGAQFLQKPLTQAAAPASFNITNQETGRKEVWKDYGGLPTVANESTMLNSTRPPFKDVTVAPNDKEMRAKIVSQS